MFFDPEFQEILNNTEYKQSKKSIFQKFIDVLSRVIFPKIKDNSILKAGIQALTDSLKEKEQKERTKLGESVEKTEEIENQAQKLINETKPKEVGKNLMDNSSISQNQQYYEGDITPEPNTIFVFGSNPEGRHGAGAAKIAKDKFGAVYGQGEGLQGNAYALPTKDLRVKENKGFKSISPEQITENIKKLYEVARQNPNKQFKIAYRNTDKTSLNGYTGYEMIEMFNNAGEIPSNIIFSKEWFDTDRLNLNNQKEKPLFSPNKNQNTMSNIKIKNQQFTETIFDILRDMRLGQRYTDGNWSYQKFKINNGNKFGEFGKGAETVRNQKKIEAVLELLGVGEAAIFKEHSNYIELSFRPYTNDKFKDSVFRKDNRDKKRIISLLKFLSAKTGVEFEEITREQADKHIKKRNKNFKIRGANVAGKAYVVTSGGDNATSEVAAEEMLHPLVEFLHRENNDLFNNLLLEARKSFPTLFAEITANYGEPGRFYEDKDGQIRLRGSNTIADRELVTQSLARIFDNKWEDVDDSQRQSFKDLIIEFLNIVKEWFSQWVTKKSNGTVEFNLKDLPETTTLNELVDLLNTKLDATLGFENVMKDMENPVRYNKISEQNTITPDIISEIEDNIC